MNFSYQSEGNGFLKPDLLAFLLFEMHAPLGMKNENQQPLNLQQQMTQKSNKRSGLQEFILNPVNKSLLQKAQIMDALRKYDLKLYSNQCIHFSDLCIKIAQIAICKRDSKPLNSLAITNPHVIKSLKKQWDIKYPYLKKMSFRLTVKSSKNGLTIGQKKNFRYTVLKWMATKLMVKNLRSILENRKIKHYQLDPRITQNFKNTQETNKKIKRKSPAPRPQPSPDNYSTFTSSLKFLGEKQREATMKVNKLTIPIEFTLLTDENLRYINEAELDKEQKLSNNTTFFKRIAKKTE